jgi:mRNA interferase RelE/StbE
VGRVVDRLEENPRPGQATQLVGDSRTWRVRAGDWRILYEIHDDEVVVLILDVRHRSRAYGGR